MWQAVKDGWQPPRDISEEEYASLKSGPPSALRGFAGTGGSFGGKWFAGYARGGKQANGSPRNHQAESARAVMKQATAMAHANIVAGSYEQLTVNSTCVIYCDPPYASTLNYKAVGEFDHDKFWTIAEQWTNQGALVLVSEYSAPGGWRCIAQFDHRRSVCLAGDRKANVERVFMLNEPGA